jgi:hypothetical protein
MHDPSHRLQAYPSRPNISNAQPVTLVDLLPAGQYLIRNVVTLRFWYLIGSPLNFDGICTYSLALSSVATSDDCKVCPALFLPIPPLILTHTTLQFHVTQDAWHPGAYLLHTDYGGRCAGPAFTTTQTPSPYRFFPVCEDGTYFLCVHHFLSRNVQLVTSNGIKHQPGLDQRPTDGGDG